MTDELTFAVELTQTLEANVARKAMIFFSHVAHEEFVAGEFFAAAFARHVLRLLEKIEIVQDECELGGRQ